MFPVATAAPFARNVVNRGILAMFYSVFKFYYVLLSFLTIYRGIRDGPWEEISCRVPEAQRLTTFGPRSTTDASTFPSDPSPSVGVTYVFHVLIKV